MTHTPERLRRRPDEDAGDGLADHVKQASPEWQRLYEAVRAAVRRDRAEAAALAPRWPNAADRNEG